MAMFDIKPNSRSEGFNLHKVIKIQDEITELPKIYKKLLPPKTTLYTPMRPHGSVENKKTAPEEPIVAMPPINEAENLIAQICNIPEPEKEPPVFNKDQFLQEFERTLSEPLDIVSELSSVGGRFHSSSGGRPRPRPILRKTNQGAKQDEIENEQKEKAAAKENKIIADVVSAPPPAGENQPKPDTLKQFWVPTAAPDRQPEVETAPAPRSIKPKAKAASFHKVSPASREIDIWLENIQKNRLAFPPDSRSLKSKHGYFFRIKPKWPSWFRRKPVSYFLISFLAASAMIGGLAWHKSIGVQNNVVKNGDNAIANLEDAKTKLESFNFKDAANSFALAYDDFNKASGTLSQFGASFLSIFGQVPGLSKIKAANNLVEAGGNISKAGENLALAFSTLYKTNPLSFLDNSQIAPRGASLSQVLAEFKDVLLFADKNIRKAGRLLADIDVATIPEDKQQLFINFQDKIPQFQKYIGDAIDYSDVLLKLIGKNGPKTYLVLLQNNSELRPTGGFPGTYALVTFDGGYLKKIFVDDIYQIDAGIKQNIIPPLQMQHITVNWGLRDANWFADFPTSAKKIEDFYKLDGGGQLDGVLAITPDVITRMLDVVGPIDMPEYGMKLTSANFLDQIQEEVEYKADRSKPKKIVSDLQPKFFAKLTEQDKDGWVKIFKIMLEATQEKHILAFFNDPGLQEVAAKNDIAGDIKQTAGDYLQVVFTNIKGSKTDFVTENSMALKVATGNGGQIEHELTINRVHKGGDSKYGFYNKTNPAYVRVYAPRGSVFEGIVGQSIVNINPLMHYEDYGFKKDPDLEMLEKNTTHPYAGVDVSDESGKTVFGFWLVTKPKESKTVTLKYSTPAENGRYALLWQKQSGTDGYNMNFNFKIPAGNRARLNSPDLKLIGDSAVMSSDLSVDRKIDIEFTQ